MISGIVTKELNGVARRWQTYLGRVFYVGMIALLLYQFVATRDLRRLSNPSELADLGRRLFMSFVPFQMLFVTLISLSAASDMLSKEVRAGTLGLLTLTPLTPVRIVFGKWRATMVYAGSTILCGVPVLAICVYLGGTSLYDLGVTTVLTVVDAALAAALALFYSTVFRAGYVTILMGILTLTAYAITPVFMMIADHGDGLLKFFCWTHPAFAAGAALLARHSVDIDTFSWVGATGCTAVIGWFLLRCAGYRVPGLAAAVPKQSLLTKTFQAMDRFYENAGPKAIRNVRVFGGSNEVWQRNAILWKELRTRATGKLHYATRVGLFLLLLLALPASCTMGGSSGWEPGILWLGSILLVFIAIGNGIALFVKEKEGRQWDVLLSTPLTAAQIVDAKLQAGLMSLIPLGGVLLAFFTILVWFVHLGTLTWLVTAGALSLLVLLAYTLSAAASLRCATMRTAFGLSFGILSSVLLLLPLMMSFYDALPGVHWNKDEFPFLLVTITNPMTFLAPLFSRQDYYGGYGGPRYDDLLGYFMVYSLLYGGGIVALRIYMVAGLDVLSGRSSEGLWTPPARKKDEA